MSSSFPFPSLSSSPVTPTPPPPTSLPISTPRRTSTPQSTSTPPTSPFPTSSPDFTTIITSSDLLASNDITSPTSSGPTTTPGALATVTPISHIVGTSTHTQDPPPTPSTLSTPTSANDPERRSLGPIIGGVVGGILFLALFVAAVFILLKRQRRAQGDGEALHTSKRAGAPTPYEYSLPPPSHSPADSKGSHAACTSISNPTSPAAHHSSGHNVKASKSEKRRPDSAAHLDPIATKGPMEQLVVNNNLNRRLTSQTVASQQTAHSEAPPAYHSFAVA